MIQKTGEFLPPRSFEKSFVLLHKQLAETGLVCYNHTILKGISIDFNTFNIRRIQL